MGLEEAGCPDSLFGGMTKATAGMFSLLSMLLNSAAWSCKLLFSGPVMIALEKINGSHTPQYSRGIRPTPLRPPEYHFQLTPLRVSASAIVGCACGGMRYTSGPNDAGSPAGENPAP